MAKKYIKNEKGTVKSITTDNLQLEKPLLNENYDIEVHNRNMDKIDNAIKEVKGQVSGLELKAEKVSIADEEGLFEATNVEDALLENKTSISNNTDLANQALNRANEAFQRGDNVKTQLVDKLISEGLDVSTNNTFEELIGSIALGKKWASGTASSSSTADRKKFVCVNGSDCNCNYFNITNLSFTPKHIIYICKANPRSFGFLSCISNYYTSKGSILITQNYTDSSANNLTYHLSLEGVFDGTSVTLPILTGDTGKHEWIAFE